jgi:signal transduction histidine kinase
MFKHLKIGQKFILSFLILTIGPLLSVAYLSYSISKYQLEKKIVDSFTALNNARASHINNIVQLQFNQARELASTFLSRQVSEASTDGHWQPNKVQGDLESILKEIMDKPHSRYLNIDRISDVRSIGLVDLSGKVIADTNKEQIGTVLPREDMELIKEKGRFFGGLHQDKQSGQSYLVVLDGLRFWDIGEFTGAIFMRFQGDILNKITGDFSGLGVSGESYLVNRDLVMITPSRFQSDSAFKRKVDTPASRSCFAGSDAPLMYQSYSGKPVLGVASYLAELDWCLISEMETREAFLSIEQLRNVMLLLIAIVVTLVLIFIDLINRIFISPIIELRNAANRVGAGHFDVQVKARSRDELGELTQTFNQMIANLKQDKLTLQEQKQDLEKVNRELDSFVYTASHDLRAPLRGIASFASFLEEDYKNKLDEQGIGHLKEIRDGADRLSLLIDDLLLLSRISRIKNPYEEVDIARVVAQVCEQLKFDIEDKNIDMRVGKDLPRIVCDPIKTKTAILNLVNNAIKFASKENKERPFVEIGYNERAQFHEFYVKDNGIGIDPQFHDKIFILFRKLHPVREYDGTGAGLSIVRRIVEDQGGEIWVDSREGQGATFFFTVPKNLAQNASAKK